MILIDANLLVYVHVASLSQHEAAGSWLDERLNGTAPVGLAWPSLLVWSRTLAFLSDLSPLAAPGDKSSSGSTVHRSTSLRQPSATAKCLAP